MILYSITFNIENAVQKDWLSWVKASYLPQLMATGLIHENKILRLLHEEDNGGTTYSLQLYLKSMEDYKSLTTVHEDDIYIQMVEKYRGNYVDFRTILEVV